LLHPRKECPRHPPWAHDQRAEARVGGQPDPVATLKTRIPCARLRTAVNRELMLLYWEIGRDILVRQAAEGWGTAVIDRLARDSPADVPTIGLILCKGRNEVMMPSRPSPTECLIRWPRRGDQAKPQAPVMTTTATRRVLPQSRPAFAHR